MLDGTISPGDLWQGDYRLTPTRRGAYRFGSAYLRVELPLGLLRRQFRYRIDGPVSVYPNLLALRRYDLLSSRSRVSELTM